MPIVYEKCPYCQSVLDKQTYSDLNIQGIVEVHQHCNNCDEFKYDYVYGTNTYELKKNFTIEYKDYIYSQKIIRKIESLISELLKEKKNDI